MRGFTLLETLIAILIFSVIVVAMGMTVVAGQRSLFTTDVPTQLRQSILFSLITMSKELRQTAPSKTNLASGTSSNTITFQIPHDNDADGSTVDIDGTIEWGNSITYTLNGNQIIRTQNGVNKILGSNISGLLFTRPSGNNTIQLDITAQAQNNTGNWTDTEQAIITMRN